MPPCAAVENTAQIKRRLRDFSNEQFDAVLKHTEATAQDWVKEVKSRIAKIDARAAEASRRAAARSAGDEDEGNSRTRSVQVSLRFFPGFGLANNVCSRLKETELFVDCL